MKQLYLHVGAEKTGTTTLQEFLADNEQVLNWCGFTFFCDPEKPYYYQASPGIAGHFPVAACFFDERPDFVPHDKFSPARDVLGALKRDLECNTKNVILSCEHFSSRLSSIEHLSALRDAFSGYAVTVVCYVRRQDELALAAYSSAVKAGHRRSFAQHDVHPGNQYFNFLAMLEPWAAVFGADNIIVRNYSRASLVGGDVRKDFLRLIDVRGVGKFVYGPNRNVSLDAKQVEALRLINCHLSAFEDADIDAFDRAQFIRESLKGLLPEGEPLGGLLSADERKAIIDRFRASNAKVERRYMAHGALKDWERSNGQNFGPLTDFVSAFDMAELAAKLAGDAFDRERDVIRLQNELDRVLQSRSWRLTRLMRNISGLWRRLLGAETTATIQERGEFALEPANQCFGNEGTVAVAGRHQSVKASRRYGA